MTQYHYERPPTTAIEPLERQAVQERNALERQIRSLEQRVQQQDTELRDLQRTLRKLQNEVRVAVNSFNTKHRG